MVVYECIFLIFTKVDVLVRGCRCINLSERLEWNLPVFVWDQTLACYLKHTGREEVKWVRLGDMGLVHVPSRLLPMYCLTLVFKLTHY